MEENGVFLVIGIYAIFMPLLALQGEVRFDGVPVRTQLLGSAISALGLLEIARWGIGLGDFHLAMGGPILAWGAYLYISGSWGSPP